MTNKEIAEQWFDGIWNLKNPQVIYDLMHADALAHTEGGSITGPEQFVQHMFVPFSTAFPDMHITLDKVLSVEDDVVLRWTATGVHAGEIAGIAPVGRRISFSGMTWLTFRDGKISGGWDRWNLNGLLGLLQQGVPCVTAKFLD